MLYDNERAIVIYQVSALKNGALLAEDDLATLLKSSYLLLNSTDSDDYNICLSAICHAAEVEPKTLRISMLLNECIIKSRVFLYREMLANANGKNEIAPELDLFASFARDFYSSEVSDTVFTRDQKTILDEYRKHPRIIVSAPTSFGKTKIIEEILLEHDYMNIVLIFPTVALLSEQYNKLKKSPLGKRYTISKSSRTNASKGKNILVLTPERLISFLDDNHGFTIDFFAMDEIYKTDVDSEDDRFRVFTYCLYRLSKMSKRFYLIGPFFTDFSKGFCDRFDAKFLKFNSEIVQKDFFNKTDLISGRFSGSPIRVIQNENKTLTRSLEAIKDKRSLVYRYRKDSAERTAQFIATSKPQSEHYDQALIDYIAETVSPKWSLIDCLKKGVAFHHGGIPRHIQEAIVQSFEKGEIEQIVCTTSLTEGVNTSAKSVFLLDNYLGMKTRPLKPFERKNIEGRSGRFRTHFTGNVVYLDDIGEDNDDDYKIDLEYWEGDSITPESLMQVEHSDLKETDKSKKRDLLNELSDLRISETLIKMNRYIDIQGQVSLIKYLRENIETIDCCFSGPIPDNDTLGKILSFTYQFLFNESDKHSKRWTEKQIIAITRYWVGKRPTIPALVHYDILSSSQDINTRIRNTFTFTSHFLEFAWPKYIKAFSNIYNYVALESGNSEINLEYLLMRLEYGTDELHEVILKDAGIPNDIIKKVGHLFVGCESFDEAHLKLPSIDQQLMNLLSNFEYSLITDYI